MGHSGSLRIWRAEPIRDRSELVTNDIKSQGNGAPNQVPRLALDCDVLVIDDDGDCLDEFAELVGSLGYTVLTCSDAQSALRLIAEEPKIGIVITDLNMPGLNGLALLEEISSRYDMTRPLVSFVVTGEATLQSAVDALRSHAIDYLAKPVSPETLRSALRRASEQRTQMVLQQMLLADRVAHSRVSAGFGSKSSDQELARAIRRVMRLRRKRKELLHSELFADPPWDILLDLTLAKLDGKTVTVSDACIAAQVPFTTAFRYLNALVDSGLLHRTKDLQDKRRIIVEIDPKVPSLMKRLLLDGL